ncbi:MAG: hypothetical protein ACK4QP_17625 [Pseudorhizobium sp.]
MTEEQIPNFLAPGRDMRRPTSNVVGDPDLSGKAFEKAQPELDRIWEEYGPHDHLKQEIIAYLHSIGRGAIPVQLVTDGYS